MASGLAKILNIEKGEGSTVSVLLFQSVFLGFFAGSFDVSAQSYFLEVFSADLIPKAFAYSGGVGIIMTSVYSFLQSRMRFSIFSVLNLFVIAILTLTLRLGFDFFDNELLVFAMFVLMGPLTIISFLGFWGTVSRLFSLRQGKRLFGLIDTGQIMGIIIASYAIPVLLSFNFKILDSLYICSGSIIIALLIQIVISSRFSLRGTVVANDHKKKSNFLDLFKYKYTTLMVGFVIFSVFAAFFIHYSFLVVTEENYADPNALASFLGVFMGTVMVFTLIIKTFVYSRLMKTYGIKLALTISPILLGIFVIGALVVGTLKGYTFASAGFSMFFLLMVSGKLFSKSFKDSIEVPSSKILYQSLDPEVRYDVQSRVDGTVNELAAFSAGLLMAGLAMISSFKLIHFSAALAGILLIWLFLAFRLHRAYKKSLRDSLKKYQQAEKESDAETFLISKMDPESLSKSEIERILEYAPQSWNGFLSGNIGTFLKSSPDIQKLTLEWIDQLNIDESKDELIEKESSSDSKLKSLWDSLLKRFQTGKVESSKLSLSGLIESGNPEDKLKALVLMREISDNETTSQYISLLLKDHNFKVRISTIRFIGRENLTEFAPRLIDLLEHNRFYPFAYNALKSMGIEILDRLEQAFQRTSVSILLSERLLSLLCLIDSPQVIPLLLNKLDQPQVSFHRKVMHRLGEIEYTPEPAILQRLSEYLQKIIGVTAWNISVKLSLIEENYNPELIKCFEQEIKDNYEFVFDILKVMYDSQTINQIKQNIETGSAESVGYSLELLDLFVDENIKQVLFVLLEDSSDSVKMLSLQSEYPLEMLKAKDLLHSIINRDFNHLHNYTRILAILELSKVKNYKPGIELIAHMFNPDSYISEVAAGQMYYFDEDVYREVLNRLPAKKSRELNTYAEKAKADRKKFLGDSIIWSLKKSGYFDEISVFDLYEFSEKFIPFDVQEGMDYQVLKETGKHIMLFFTKGFVELRKNDGTIVSRLKSNSFHQLSSVISADPDFYSLRASEDMTLMILKEDSLRELVFDKEKIFMPLIGRLFQKEIAE